MRRSPAPLRLGAALAAIAFFTSSCITTSTADARDEAAIRQSVLAMTEAFNRRDDAALIALAAPNADYVTVVGRWTRGTAAYVQSRRSRLVDR